MGRRAKQQPAQKASFDVPYFRREVGYVVGRALKYDSRLVTFGRLVFLSNQTRDAWLLDPADRFASCLARDGSGLSICGTLGSLSSF